MWYRARKPSELPQPSEATQLKFDQGIEIGMLAQSLFDDGLVLNHSDFFKGIADTHEALKSRRVLFEAAFYDKEKNLYSRADILVPSGEDAWDIYEIKSSASVKSEYVEDMAFQKYVYERAGLNINNCYIMHVNTKYLRQGNLDLSQFFKIENINEKLESVFQEISLRIDEENHIISTDNPPPPQLGVRCFNPYECPLKEKCWQNVPDGSVFELSGGNRIPGELWKQGYTYLKDVPANMLEFNEKQRNQIIAYQQGQAHIEKEKIEEWLKQLQYPLYFLDFETYDTAVPLYDGCRPYQKIPFQFSLHIQQEKDGPITHISYLANGHGDERAEFAAVLKQSLGENGSIVVYYDSFEKKVIREIGELFMEYAQWSEETCQRVVDLLVPFQEYYFHSQLQKGSTSIKKVLPALSDKNYDDMNISNGELASYYFTRIVLGKALDDEKSKTRQDLLDYCQLDTYSMVLLISALYKLANGQTIKLKKDKPKLNEQLRFPI
ncbi:MAG: DUF2779 domain-containing protein [Chloroflexi bacterium]|nr:DUF2779 domain-containing protein [Chloroflexota bacterium]